MALIKLAAAGAAAYGLYRMITRQNGARTTPAPDRLWTAGLATANPGAPTTSPNTPVAQGGQFVPPT